MVIFHSYVSLPEGIHLDDRSKGTGHLKRQKTPGPRRLARQILRGGGTGGDFAPPQRTADRNGGESACELVP